MTEIKLAAPTPRQITVTENGPDSKRPVYVKIETPADTVHIHAREVRYGVDSDTGEVTTIHLTDPQRQPEPSDPLGIADAA